MITRLAPTFSALFPDVFLTKIAEQGFGCPARQDMVGRTNYFTGFQRQVDGLVALSSLRTPLGPAALKLLQPMKTARRLPHGFPRVDAPTARALTDLLILKDGWLSTLAGAGELVAGYAPARAEHHPWFLLLHSLEEFGVLQGIEETREGEMITPGFPPHPGGRTFAVDKVRLAAYRKDSQKYHNARVVTDGARSIDADAEALLKLLPPA